MADGSTDAGAAGEPRAPDGSWAELYELDPHAEGAGPHRSVPSEQTAGERCLAGLWVERGALPKALLDRWRKAVISGSYDAESCARELLAARDPAADASWLPERAGRLLRDFLMEDVMRDGGRRARVAAKRGLAFFVAQIAVLALFALLAFLFLVILRVKGVSLDGGIDRFMDGIVSWLPG